MDNSTNYFEDELLQILGTDVHTGIITIEPDCTDYFVKLAKCFPAAGTKIDWGRVPNSINTWRDEDRDESAFVEFFNQIVTSNNLSGPIVYMGDSNTEFALLTSIDVVSKYLKDILSIPQHHYFVAADFSWCIAFTFEGDMSFGYAP